MENGSAPSFDAYRRGRRLALVLVVMTAAFVVGYAIVVVAARGQGGGAWTKAEGVLMLAGGASAVALAVALARNAAFKCPRCGRPFFRAVAGGGELYGSARACRNCGLERPSD